MKTVWMIRDNTTGEYIRSTTHNGTTDIVQGDNTHPSLGRIWQQKNTILDHISKNREFYKRHMDRLELVEMSVEPIDTSPILDMLAIDMARFLAR